MAVILVINKDCNNHYYHHYRKTELHVPKILQLSQTQNQTIKKSYKKCCEVQNIKI